MGDGGRRMKLRNNKTGDVLEVPPPDSLGASVINFNGRIVEHVLYSDDGSGSATIGDGRTFTIKQWTEYLLEKLNTGAWSAE